MERLEILKDNTIASLTKYLSSSHKEKSVFIGLRDIIKYDSLLTNIGFSWDYKNGDSILPPVYFGPGCKFNALGKQEIHKDKPKETFYIIRAFTKRDGSIDPTRVKEVLHHRFPFTYITPPSIELQIAETKDNDFILVTPSFNSSSQKDELIHTAKMFLEIFGEFELFINNNKLIIKNPVKKLNWEFVRNSDRNKEKIATLINNIISDAPKGNQNLLNGRMKVIYQYNPEFVSFGRGGFLGCIIFGYSRVNKIILENTDNRKGTVFFDKDWETVSRMSKAEIYQEHNYMSCIGYGKNWYNETTSQLENANID